MQVDEHATVAFLDLCVCAWDVYQLLICGCVGLAPKMTHHQYLQPNHVFMIQIHTQQPTITWRPLKKSNSIGCTIIKYYKPSIWWYLHLWNPPIVNISRNTRSLLVKSRVSPGCRAPCRTPARWLGRHETGAGSRGNDGNRMETNIETHGNPWKTHGNDGLWQMNFIEFSSGAILGCQVWEYSHMSQTAQSNFAWLLHWIRFWLGWFGLVGLAEVPVRFHFASPSLSLAVVCPKQDSSWYFSMIFHYFHPFSPIFTNFHQFSIMFHHVPVFSNFPVIMIPNHPNRGCRVMSDTAPGPTDGAGESQGHRKGVVWPGRI